MKINVATAPPSLLIVLILAFGGVGHCESKEAAHISKNDLGPLIEMEDSPIEVNQWIISLSKKSHINIIADSTRLDNSLKISPFTTFEPPSYPKPYFSSLLAALEAQQGLGDVHYKDAVLVWDRPDARKVAKLIVSSGKNYPQEMLPLEADLYTSLSPYLRANVNPFQIGQESKVFTLGTMPASLQSRVVAFSRYGYLRPEWHVEQLLSDEFWKKAVVRRPSNPTNDSFVLGLNAKNSADSVERFFRFSIIGLEADEEPFALRGVFRPKEDEESPKQAPFENTPLAPAISTGSKRPIFKTVEKKGLTEGELGAIDVLRQPVSLEAKHASLKQLFALVGKLAPVKLRVEEPAFEENRVTLHVEKMPLCTLMSALAQTFNIGWSSDAKGTWSARSDGSDELEKLIERGSLTFYRAEMSLDERQERLAKLNQAVGETLQVSPDSTNPVAFLSLTPDVQKEVRDEFEWETASFLVLGYQESYKFLAPDSLIIVSNEGLVGGQIGIGIKRASGYGGVSTVLKPKPPEKSPQADIANEAQQQKDTQDIQEKP